MLFLLLGCTKAVVEPVAPVPTYSLRVVSGPWTDADSLALGSSGPIVMAAFVQDTVLWFTTSLDGGRGWTVPVAVDRDVELDVEGQVRPRLQLGGGNTLIAYAKDGAPHVASRDQMGWEVQRIPDATGRLLDLTIRGGVPLLVWVDRGQEPATLWQWDGQATSIVTETPVDPCSRPALEAGVDQALLAARTPDGQVQEWLEDLDWTWMDQGLNGAAGGACLRDGPHFDRGAPVWVEGGRLVRDGARLPFPDEAGWTASQARAAGALLVWQEHQDDTYRVFIDGVPLLTREGAAFRVGDPIRAGGEVWVPFVGDDAMVAAYRSDELPD